MIFYDVSEGKKRKKTSVFTFLRKTIASHRSLSFLRYHHNARVCEEKEEKRRSLSRHHVVWSEDESAEKEDWGARFFVGFDREVRRCLFQTHSSEIE